MVLVLQIHWNDTTLIFIGKVLTGTICINLLQQKNMTKVKIYLPFCPSDGFPHFILSTAHFGTYVQSSGTIP